MQEIKIDEPREYNLCEIFSDAGAFLVATSLPYRTERTSIRIDRFSYDLLKYLRLYIKRRFRLRGFAKLTTFVIFYGLKKIKKELSKNGIKNIDDVDISLSSVMYSVAKFPKVYNQTDVVNIYCLHELGEVVDDIDFVFRNKTVMYSVAVNEFFYDLLGCNLIKLKSDDIKRINEVHNTFILVIKFISSVSRSGKK